ncbi:hypothetical protein DPMN_013259 [Dreissena polymorpha]|uniref:HTH TFE/IIEalpha-type domain-containing protein n=1 Tax=Dreissena polymorpha TaxID=45954 RepID=A0A9D4N7D1_DREPO|nr:hypothetical protein DPMN_013259 [Dreissena polymorpha]
MPAVKRQKRPVKRVLKDCLVCSTCFARHRETGLGMLHCMKSLIRLCLHMKRLGEEEVIRIIDKFTEKPRNVDL